MFDQIKAFIISMMRLRLLSSPYRKAHHLFNAIVIIPSSLKLANSSNIFPSPPNTQYDSGDDVDFLFHEASLGLGYFEEWERHLGPSNYTTTTTKDAHIISHHENASIDIRVARAIGSHGYDKIRLSVISTLKDEDKEGSHTPPHMFLDGNSNAINFTYQEHFRHRWKSAFDLGKSGVSCSEYYKTMETREKLNGASIKDYDHLVDADCLDACSNDTKCNYYTYFSGNNESSSKCELSSSCDYITNKAAEATYAKEGYWFLRSAIVPIEAGKDNLFIVDDHQIHVRIPPQYGGTKGIIIGDPCFSSRWIGCQHGKEWDTYARTIKMMNAVAVDPELHFFQILGDNFYDQDGRITKVLYDELSVALKSKILLTVPGNHDVWVCGGPECADQYDQYGYGFMQYYAQDTIFSAHNSHMDGGGLFLNFSDDPDFTPSWHRMNNDPANFFQYHMIGNLGFIAYIGTSSFEEVRSYFIEACDYMADQKPSFIFLLGHWNNDTGGCKTGMAVPDVYDKLQNIHGCNVGDRLKYFDGHTHQNKVQENGQNEEIGFMVGGHGMKTVGKNRYGFAYVESTPEGRLKIYYFDERSENSDQYDDILNCVNRHGGRLDNCVHLADLWLDTKIPDMSGKTLVKEVVVNTNRS